MSSVPAIASRIVAMVQTAREARGERALTVALTSFRAFDDTDATALTFGATRDGTFLGSLSTRIDGYAISNGGVSLEREEARLVATVERWLNRIDR
jgi:hypothetical protein